METALYWPYLSSFFFFFFVMAYRSSSLTGNSMDWALCFGLQFASACHPIWRLSPSSGTNPAGHYEAGLIPRTAAAGAFQERFQSMIPCLSHASASFRRGCSASLWSHSIVNVVPYPQPSEGTTAQDQSHATCSVQILCLLVTEA